jgi:hypothetical protein
LPFLRPLNEPFEDEDWPGEGKKIKAINKTKREDLLVGGLEVP